MKKPSRAHHRGNSPESRIGWLAGWTALGCGAAGLLLSFNYPIAQPWMTVLFSLVAIALFFWPFGWLTLTPGALPLIGFAPWTGWVTFEELDLLILAIAAAGYARLAFRMPFASKRVSELSHQDSTQKPGLSAAPIAMIALFSASILVAMFRGFDDAGGFSFGWLQGYHEPMNSVRLAKSFATAILVIPLWLVLYKQNSERSKNSLSLGLMLGLAGAALTTVWERAAFTNLMNFSADYRTTGLFWEMHVGGAALDGYLALTVPFALRELLAARTPLRWSLAASVMVLAAYTCLTTFSRGVFLAVPVGLMVFLAHYSWQRKQFPTTTSSTASDTHFDLHLSSTLLLATAFGAGALWIFETSGYRGMGALLVAMALLLPLAQVLRGFKQSEWILGSFMGAILTTLGIALTGLILKGAYWALCLSAGWTATMLILLRVGGHHASRITAAMAFAGYLSTLTTAVMVAHHWGLVPGLLHAAPVMLVLLIVAITAGLSRKPLWQDAFRWQATSVGIMGIVAVGIGVMGGGTYMTERFSTGAQDFDGRLAHWKQGLNMLHGHTDWLLGKGLGRFPANYFLDGNPKEHTGDYRLKSEQGNNYITLTGGLHVNGWGEMFRITQRISEPVKTAVVTARVRAKQTVRLHFEICEKHLLYSQSCLLQEVNIKGNSGVWQPLRIELKGSGANRGDWYAPRLLAFSMAMASQGGVADIDEVTLTGDDGRMLLSNGDFSEDMANWFFSSDRHHLPWHIKSVFANVLFDQGIVGLSLWSMLLVGALWQTCLGRARFHPLAPALTAALISFALVGLFDSLLDVPRLGWLFYFLVLLSWTLQGPPRHRP